jgi:serine/threonine protein kinase
MEGYKVTRQLGEGTFGRVLEGEKKGRRYAIKVPVILCRSSDPFKNTWSRPKSKSKSSKTSIAVMKKMRKESFATKNPSTTRSTYA